jgi:probable rRNA maturation factor
MNLNFKNQTKQNKWYHYKQNLVIVFQIIVHRFKLNPETQVSCILVNDATMHHYNYNYRHVNRSTDVLTFVDDIEPNHLGDVIINVDAVVKQASDYDHTLTRELCFLFAHGVLHTLGYDHHSPEQEKDMISLQKEILSHVSKRRYRKSNSQV